MPKDFSRRYIIIGVPGNSCWIGVGINLVLDGKYRRHGILEINSRVNLVYYFYKWHKEERAIPKALVLQKTLNSQEVTIQVSGDQR